MHTRRCNLVMALSCTWYYLLMQSVSASCKGDAGGCKTPTCLGDNSDAFSMVQHFKTKIAVEAPEKKLETHGGKGQKNKTRYNEKANFRVIVLNLDRRPDRLQRVTHALRTVWPDASICRQRSIDGSNVEEVNALVENTSIVTSIFQPAAVACYGTHYYAWQRVAQDRTIDFAVIAEDDLALFSDDFHAQFSKLLKKGFWQNKQWVHLQWDSRSWPKKTGVRVAEPTVLNDMAGQKPYNTAMYAITPSSAKELMRWAQKGLVRSTFDGFIPSQALQSYFAFEPPIAQVDQQNGRDSNIWTLSRIAPLLACELSATVQDSSWSQAGTNDHDQAGAPFHSSGVKLGPMIMISFVAAIL